MNLLAFNLKWDICKYLSVNQYFKIRLINKSFTFNSCKDYLFLKILDIDDFIDKFQTKYLIFKNYFKSLSHKKINKTKNKQIK